MLEFKGKKSLEKSHLISQIKLNVPCSFWPGGYCSQKEIAQNQKIKDHIPQTKDQSELLLYVCKIIKLVFKKKFD